MYDGLTCFDYVCLRGRLIFSHNSCRRRGVMASRLRAPAIVTHLLRTFSTFCFENRPPPAPLQPTRTIFRHLAVMAFLLCCLSAFDSDFYRVNNMVSGRSKAIGNRVLARLLPNMVLAISIYIHIYIYIPCTMFEYRFESH